MRKARVVVSRPHGLPKVLLAKGFPKDSQVGVGRIICSQDVHIMGSICSCCPLAVTWLTVFRGLHVSNVFPRDSQGGKQNWGETEQMGTQWQPIGKHTEVLMRVYIIPFFASK